MNIQNDVLHPAPGLKMAFLLVLLSCCSFLSQAQRPPHASRMPLRPIAEIPFTTFTGGVMVIRLQLAGHPDTLNFILDTGSGGISMDSGTCIRLNITPTPTDRLIVGIGGARQVRFLYNQTVYLAGLKLDSLDLHVSDYSVLSSIYGDQIDGIIGYSFFSRYQIKIDYDSDRVYVYRKSANIRYPRGGFYLRPSIVNIPVEHAIIREERVYDSRFYFDTGAGLCLLLSTAFTGDSAIFLPGKKMWPTQAQGLGGKANMELTTIKEIHIGPYRFKNVPTHIFNDEYNITSYPFLGGLMGNDLLRRFNVYMNYEKRTFYLITNSHYRDAFDYSYTGLSLYWIDGAVRVGDVMKDSPAEQAGLKVDDVVLAINNNMTHNLQTYKSMIQEVGSKIKFLVSRPEGLVELNMRVRSIL